MMMMMTFAFIFYMDTDYDDVHALKEEKNHYVVNTRKAPNSTAG